MNHPPKSTSRLSDALSTLSPILLLVSIVTLILWISRKYAAPVRKLPYPPGPQPRDFLSGNARDLSTTPLWFKLTDWATTYGPLVHLKSFNEHILVVNSVDDGLELMEKRSNNYSDRPYIPMLDMTGWIAITPFKTYGTVWQRHRRLFQQGFRPAASLEYRTIQAEKTNDMLISLLDSPQDFFTHNKTLPVAIIMAIMYGYKVSQKNDYFQELAEIAINDLSNAALPSGSIVNIVPFLSYLPPWFPGTGFHSVAEQARRRLSDFMNVPYKYALDHVGTASPSFVEKHIVDCKTEEEDEVLKAMSATGFTGGADTTASSMGTFFYAMAVFPQVQTKAQEELDRVIGHDRLVDYNDADSLPYIQALCREVLRWRPVVPLGVFHMSISEDVYKGYYIPKGTTIISNAWAMSRDPSRYKDPEEFNPDRYFTEANEITKDDTAFVFGFGRRICPGRHLAFDTLWLAIASILSTFDIRLPIDASGKDIPLNVEYTPGLISHPAPFECRITPRSEKAKQLIIDLENSNA